MIPFARTACACAACTEGCLRQPGPLAPGELEQIAAHLQKPIRDVLQYFRASPGALIADRVTGEPRMVPTITPAMRKGRCVFLDPDNRCRIHAVSPFGCRMFDSHQEPEEWQPRGAYLYQAIERSREYQSQRSALAPATSWNPVGLERTP